MLIGMNTSLKHVIPKFLITALLLSLLLLLLLPARSLAQEISDEETSGTRVEVASVIEVTGPGLLAFGQGVPGDTLSLDGLVQVRTNHPAGYDLSWAATDMINDNDGIIAADHLAATLDGAVSSGSEQRTGGEGLEHALAVVLQLPFVESALYSGTMTFTALTH